MKLFVDDIRTPVDSSWEIARTVDQAIDLIKKALFYGESLDHISLDHDLGDDQTSRALVNWMVSHGIRFEYGSVHSANPVGVQWLEMALNRDFGDPIPIVTAPAYQ